MFTIRSQYWRGQTFRRVYVYELDVEHLHRQIPDDEAHSTPPCSDLRTVVVVKAPLYPRSEGRAKANQPAPEPIVVEDHGY